MAIKRSFGVKDKNGRACLKCGRQIPIEAIKDDTIHTCACCGQQMFVDKYGSRAVLTVCERPELRKRLEQKPKDDKDTEIAKLKAQLAAAQKSADEWKAAAEGLSKIIEEHNDEKSC